MRVLQCDDIFPLGNKSAPTTLASTRNDGLLLEGGIIKQVLSPPDALCQVHISGSGNGYNVGVFAEWFESYWIMDFSCGFPRVVKVNKVVRSKRLLRDRICIVMVSGEKFGFGV